MSEGGFPHDPYAPHWQPLGIQVEKQLDLSSMSEDLWSVLENGNVPVAVSHSDSGSVALVRWYAAAIEVLGDVQIHYYDRYSPWTAKHPSSSTTVLHSS